MVQPVASSGASAGINANSNAGGANASQDALKPLIDMLQKLLQSDKSKGSQDSQGSGGGGDCQGAGGGGGGIEDLQKKLTSGEKLSPGEQSKLKDYLKSHGIGGDQANQLMGGGGDAGGSAGAAAVDSGDITG